MAENNGSATTVLVSIILVVIIGLAFYFGFARGEVDNPGTNINVEIPTGGNEGGQ